MTCIVNCAEADISDLKRNQYAGLGEGEEGGNTTNQADYFQIYASKKINFYQWETKRFNTTAYTKFTTTLAFWKTQIFDASYCSNTVGISVGTLNVADGSILSADTFIGPTGADDLAYTMLIQLWNNSPYTNVFFTFDVGYMTSSFVGGGPYLPISFYSYVSTNATLNRFATSVPSGIFLPRRTYDGDSLAPNYVGTGGLYNSSVNVIGSFYEPKLNTNVTRP